MAVTWFCERFCDTLQTRSVCYHECGWEPWEIESRLKHYEGIDNHDWA